MKGDAIGLDIGGANLKAATPSRQAVTRPFELWRYPDRLADELFDIRQLLPKIPRLAVTMTGELCDCFPTKRDGVRHILAAVRQAFHGMDQLTWTTAGCFVSLPRAEAEDAPSAAAANWLALATFAGRFAPVGPALVIDTGSTTTDIIPLLDGRPVPQGRTDPERLQSGELVYTGVRRTPVCALVGEGVAAEWFATAHDVHVLRGDLPEEPGDRATADGRPMTRPYAHARLCRMLGGDSETTSAIETNNLAQKAAERQRAMIGDGIELVMSRLPDAPRTIVLSGSGEFLARAAWDDLIRRRSVSPAQICSLSDHFAREISEAACAYALAVLAAELVPCE